MRPDDVLTQPESIHRALVLAVPAAVDTGQVKDALAACQSSLGARGDLLLAACGVARKVVRVLRGATQFEIRIAMKSKALRGANKAKNGLVFVACYL